ncbi:MAG: GAP family protein [Cyanobacteria bacterium P01_H01_bin.15]
MIILLALLTPIAVLDSTSITPLCIVPLAAMLESRNPVLNVTGFAAGIFTANAGMGILLLFGLEIVFDTIGHHIGRWWSNPNTLELIAQLVIGIIMLGFAWKSGRATEKTVKQRSVDSVSMSRMYLLGAGLTLVGLPGALPYFGAVDQILRWDLGILQSLLSIAYYNCVFLLPLLVLFVLGRALPSKSKRFTKSILSFIQLWGHRVFVAGLMLLGSVLFADAIGWFVGHPLLPIGEDPAA